MVDSTSSDLSSARVLGASLGHCELDLAVLDSSGRVRVNPQQRSEILSAFDASGLSARSFAKQYGLKYTTFTNWVARRGKVPAAKSALPGSVSLVEAVIAAPEGSCSRGTAVGITIDGPSGVRIHLKDRDAVVLAVDLLRALKD